MRFWTPMPAMKNSGARGYAFEAVEHTVGLAHPNFRTQRLMFAGLGESQTPDTRAAGRLLCQAPQTVDGRCTSVGIQTLEPR